MSHEGAAPQAQEPVDRKALLLEQFTAEESAPKVEEVPAPADPADGRPRDEQGKFARKEKTETAQLIQEPQLPLEPWQSVPKSWKPELRDGWSKIDPTYQKYFHEREEQMQAGIDPLIPKAKLADEITKVAEPYINTIRGLGIDLPQAVSGLMKVDHDLRTLPYEQKLQVLQRVAMGYGVDLSGQMQTAQQAYDPAFQNIQNKLTQMEGKFQSFTEQQEAERERAAQDEIQSFAKSAEYFEEVRPTMVNLLKGGIADTIQDAYEKATRLNPEIFDKLQSGKQSAADAEKRKAADEAAKRAKASAVSVRSATPSAKGPTDKTDRRSMLREALDGLSERL